MPNPRSGRARASCDRAELSATLLMVSAPRRATLIGATAAALAAGAIVAALLVFGPLGASASGQPCSSYPTPGAPAPAGTKVPASLAAEYSVFRTPRTAVDKLGARQLASLSVSGVITSGIRFLGDAASGGRIYLVPAEHMLAMQLAPARCLRPAQRLIEQESLPLLRSEYRQTAICVDLVYGDNVVQNCSPPNGTADVLLTANGTPAFGLVPNGVSAVTVTYLTGPAATVAVARNFFAIVAPSQRALPCGLAWLNPTGNVQKIVYGCSYLKTEAHELSEYRAYVAHKLSADGAQIAALSSAIRSGDLARAKSAWLTAHLTWLDIGQDDGAYGCFGAVGGAIDGLAAGHPLGTADPGFTGFHRIEFDLWTKHDLAAAETDTATLQRLFAQLVRVPLSTYLPATPTGIGNWLLRPHEVFEDALRDSLTANDDYGSGTDLASITADVAADRELLSLVGPSLHPLAPDLVPHAEAELDALIGAIDATGAASRGGVPLEALATRQRQQVDADVDAALETLAPIPELLTSSGKNAPED